MDDDTFLMDEWAGNYVIYDTDNDKYLRVVLADSHKPRGYTLSWVDYPDIWWCSLTEEMIEGVLNICDNISGRNDGVKGTQNSRYQIVTYSIMEHREWHALDDIVLVPVVEIHDTNTCIVNFLLAERMFYG